MTNCKYKLRKLSVGLVSVGTMLIAPTVLGQEVSTSASSTKTSASTNINTNTSTASAGTGTSGTASTTPSVGTSTGGAAGGEAAVASSGGSQSSESAQASTQPQAQTAVAASASTTASPSSSEEKTPKTVLHLPHRLQQPAASSSSNGNQVTGTEVEPQMMDVEQYKVNKEKTELTVKDDKQQLKIRKDVDELKNKDLFDVKREVKDNGDGTLDVTLKVMPKQIDEGADVMALLDVSQKMTQENFNKAKEQIKRLVTTLTGKSSDGKENHNRRNSVRLMTFYRKISEPIDLSGKTSDEVEKELNKIWDKVKKEDWDWGVDLQGAIHKAREIFRSSYEKKSGKRQHIVLFSQGESTFSYDIKNKNDNKLTKARIEEEVTSSNPLLSWPPIFNHTNRKADMLNDIEYLIKLGERLGITGLDSLKNTLKLASTGSFIAGSLLGSGSLSEYLTLKEYESRTLKESNFDYTKRVGEGYYYHSFSERIQNELPLKSIIEPQLKGLFKTEDSSWFGRFLNKFSLAKGYQEFKETALLKVLEYLFYKREYIYYNHNLSAIAEAKMAQQEGITFYSVDVTSPNQSANKRTRRSADTPEEKRNKKFDNYLKEMSEGRKFLEGQDVTNKDKFKDTLTELTIKDEFTEKVTVQKDSKDKEYYKTSLIDDRPKVTHQAPYSGWLNSTKESLTWTISKDQLKKAFESGQPLTLTYKLKVEKEKFKEALKKQQERKKRAASPESENTVTDTIISNKISYKINNGTDINSNNNKLEDVKMSYSKFKMPIPELDIEVVPIPEKPLVEPMTPLYPAIPNYPTPDIPTPQLPKDEDLEISGGHGPIVDIVEDTGTGVEGGAQNGVVSTQENKDPIVDITEDTQPGMSGSNDATVVEEDTTPKRPDVLVGGQSDPIDITEDTQPSVSGSNDATVVEEDTAPKRPDILVGGQSDPIDITEDTQPGMSGSNDATVIEEDTKPKRFFHFDNEPQAPEKPKEQPSLQDSNSLPQAPAYKAAHHLPASGDKREVYFTIAALTIIGAAGLLSKKRRDTEEN
ncbi:serum opacification factor [Streptococcus pyogenes]|uniref:serum opacification factor n=1 Tax=Streptococcus pyogenes TaxID=1314 RepID=UPI000DA34EB8|nr:serum opacification factor [Streptococcus pyogenes]SQF58249.1 Fibronectin-binding protein [Streptococcus pyogenes]HEQ3178841.1 fibronectin binding protein [Streptococcus pyogenes]HER2957380.1 fibronectin binding protein [Streptococcus pyogenes]HER2991367.1 fibronectin binding protein [Streptococcus pyogenes]